MNETATKVYSARFQRVFDHIHEHLEEDLSLERLSRVANFSKFHFHRQFLAHVGVNVSRYILLRRLKRASYWLSFKDVRIIDIALEAGFENPESFTRTFKSTFGQTPSQFRKAPDWKTWHERINFPISPEHPDMDIKIIDFTQTKVAVLTHQGPHILLNESVKKFIDWRKASGLSPIASSKTFGVAYSDPNTTEPEKFRFDICGSTNADIPLNPQGVVQSVIPAGRCALVRHAGPHDKIDEVAYYLYRQWLPTSGEELRDFPLFFQYLNFFPETPEHLLLTDVFLPLK